MPWKECHIVDERLRFVARLLEGEHPARPESSFLACFRTNTEIRNQEGTLPPLSNPHRDLTGCCCHVAAVVAPVGPISDQLEMWGDLMRERRNARKRQADLTIWADRGSVERQLKEGEAIRRCLSNGRATLARSPNSGFERLHQTMFP